MGRVKFKGTIKLAHHAAQPKERGDGFPIDPEQLPKIAKEREMRIGIGLIRSNCPLAKTLPLLKIVQSPRSIDDESPLIAGLKRLLRQRSS